MNNQQPQPPKGLVKFPGIRGGQEQKVIITRLPIDPGLERHDEFSTPIEIFRCDKDGNPTDNIKRRLELDPRLVFNGHILPGREYPGKTWEELKEAVMFIDPEAKVEEKPGKNYKTELVISDEWKTTREIHFDLLGREILEARCMPGDANTHHSKYEYDDNGRLVRKKRWVTEGKQLEGTRELQQYREETQYLYEGDTIEYREINLVGQDLGHEAGQIGENTRI